MKWKNVIKRSVPTRVVRAVRYRAVDRLLREGPTPSSANPSVIFFTAQKCASTFLAQLIRVLNRRYFHLTHIDIDAYALLVSSVPDVRSYLDAVAKRGHKVFHPRGYVYGPVRRYVEVDDLDRYRVCLVLRDPRDVLVSLYYSLAYSHPLPWNPRRRRQFLESRERIGRQSIDAFALDRLDWIHERYDAYCRELVGKHGVKPLRYEDMWTDFGRWLKALGAQLGLSISVDSLVALDPRRSFPANGGDAVNRHRRHGSPGDFRDKLSAKTVRAINTKLGPIIETLGYEP